MNKENFPTWLARKAIEEFVKNKKIISPPPEIPPEFKKRAGTFVSLHKGKALRGCIGTYLPTQKNIAWEIIRNAISSATQDPRFPPVREKELSEIEVSVDVLSPPTRVKSLQELDPKKYGVIVGKGFQKGLLLPDLEGVDTVKEQLEIAKQKAGLFGVPLEELEIHRFLVKRYRER